jgi:hypothetical protein
MCRYPYPCMFKFSILNCRSVNLYVINLNLLEHDLLRATLADTPEHIIKLDVGGMTPGRVKRLERYKNYG